MTPVSLAEALAIATAEYPRFLALRRNPGDPKHPREKWIEKRVAEIMRIGATRGELELLSRIGV